MLILFLIALFRGEIRPGYRTRAHFKESYIGFIEFLKSALQTKKVRSEILVSGWRCVNGIKLIVGINLKALPFFLITIISLYVMGNLGFEEGNPEMSAKIQLQNLRERLKEYRRHCGIYPKELNFLTKSVSGKNANDGPCDHFVYHGNTEHIPRDPWDKEFVYAQTEAGKKYSLKSFGPDKVESTDDITTGGKENGF
ncbi:MAG: type II secretion system protein GspG [Bdellovibrio sp.]|nr:type II secretion system protein GspG [Bdellovibrio sp.]